MRSLIIMVAAGLLAACTHSEVVHLRNMAGQTVQCGPYELSTLGGVQDAEFLAQSKVRDCVTDFQRQGYERVAN